MKENKLLAEYLGWYIRKGSKDTYWINLNDKLNTKSNMGDVDNWQPNKDWNQLMMVVEKIEEEPEVQEVQIFKTTCNICDKIDDLVHTNRAMPRIEAVYNACVEYIKQSK